MKVLPWGVQSDGLLCSIWSFMDPGSIYLAALPFLMVSPSSTWLQFMGRWRQGEEHTEGLKAQTQKRCLPLHLHSSWVHLVTWPCWTVQAIGIWSHAQPNSITGRSERTVGNDYQCSPCLFQLYQTPPQVTPAAGSWKRKTSSSTWEIVLRLLLESRFVELAKMSFNAEK